MRIHTTKSETLHSTAAATHRLFEDWFDPIEMGVRARVRGFIEELIEAELEEALSRPRYGRATSNRTGNIEFDLGWLAGAVAKLVEIESGVVSGVYNPNDSALARRWRPRHHENP